MIRKAYRFVFFLKNYCVVSLYLLYKRKFRLMRLDIRAASFCGRPMILGNGEIVIGEGSRVNSGIEKNPIGGNGETILFVAKGAKILIGEGSGLSNVSIFSIEKITIGKRVKIGGSCKIYDNDFHSLKSSERRYPHLDLPISKAVCIGDDVFIGAHSLILKGVTIGNRSIIGAGSVVASNVPAGEVWAGNPAKFIKKCE